MKFCYDCAHITEEYMEICPFCGGNLLNNKPKKPWHLVPGDTLKGKRYAVGRAIGSGGFGVTYTGFDIMLQRRIAIKEYFPADIAARIAGQTKVTVTDDNDREKYALGLSDFVSEARIMAKLGVRTDIANIFDFFEENNTAYIVMEFLDGVNLNVYLAKNSGAVYYLKAIDIIKPICEVTAELHKEGIIHGDISPDNIFITDSGIVKLMDFGAVRYIAHKSGLNNTVVLKPGYAPPEQYQKLIIQEPSMDIYAIGATLYKMITGKTPPPSIDRIKKDSLIPPSIIQQLPRNVNQAIMRAMSLDYKSRFKTVNEFLVTLTKKSYTSAVSRSKHNGLSLFWRDLHSKEPDTLMLSPTSERLGDIAKMEGDLAKAKECYLKDLEISQQLAEETQTVEARRDLSVSFNNLGEIAQAEGDFVKAKECCLIDLGISRQLAEEMQTIEVRRGLAISFDKLGDIAKAEGDLARAKECCTKTSEFNWETAEEPQTLSGEPQTLDLQVSFSESDDTVESCNLSDKPKVDFTKVDFSVAAPKRFIKGEYSIIDIVMYEAEFRKVIDELISEADQPVKETKFGSLKIAGNSVIKIRLTSPDIEIEDNEESREWQGEYLDFKFAVLLPEKYKKRQILFIAVVFINDVIALKLKFIAKCFSFIEQKITVDRENILTAFMSYSSQDRAKVATIIQGMKKVRPDIDIFFDVENLRSGEDWEKKLYGEIDSRDILFLCWSHYARESEWVNREWRYAYKNKGAEAIEPIPLEMPAECPPPSELSKMHFNDNLLYIVKADSNLK